MTIPRRTLPAMAVAILAIAQFYHCWHLTATSRRTAEVGSVVHDGPNISPLFYSPPSSFGRLASSNATTVAAIDATVPKAFPALPTLPHNQTFGACLMVKGDNDLLTEWLPYHFTVLPLRHLLIATDTDNLEDPKDVLQRWNLAQTGLQYTIVNVSAFESTLYGPFQRNLKKDLKRFNMDLVKKGKPKINTTDDVSFQRDVAHHYLIHKQVSLISYCTQYMKERGVQWVTYHDTDEFLVINNSVMNRLHNNKSSANNVHGEKADYAATVIDILQRQFTEQENSTNKSCHVLPRVTVGAMENFTCPESESTVRFAQGSFEMFSIFNTLRFQQHAHIDDFAKNRFGKAMVDISRLSETQLEAKPNNIHRPFPKSCPRPVAPVATSPFYLLHYVGGWERFQAKNDIRRGYTEWLERASYAESTWSCAQRHYEWLPRFVNRVGLERARYLLGTESRANKD